MVAAAIAVAVVAARANREAVPPPDVEGAAAMPPSPSRPDSPWTAGDGNDGNERVSGRWRDGGGARRVKHPKFAATPREKQGRRAADATEDVLRGIRSALHPDVAAMALVDTTPPCVVLYYP
jgi:hypothetical protein